MALSKLKEVFKLMAEELRSGVHSPTRKLQPPLWKEVDAMTEKEQMTILIDNYTDLQRIKSAVDKEKEIDYQI